MRSTVSRYCGCRLNESLAYTMTYGGHSIGKSMCCPFQTIFIPFTDHGAREDSVGQGGIQPRTSTRGARDGRRLFQLPYHAILSVTRRYSNPESLFFQMYVQHRSQFSTQEFPSSAHDIVFFNKKKAAPKLLQKISIFAHHFWNSEAVIRQNTLPFQFALLTWTNWAFWWNNVENR